MNPENIVGVKMSDLGQRFNLVGMFPSVTLFVLILAHFWSGAPFAQPNPDAILSHVRALDAKEGVFYILGLLALTVLLHPLQLPLVRLLEGYWGSTRLARFLSKFSIDAHRQRRDRLEKGQIVLSAEEPTESDRRRMEDAAYKLRRFYPAKDRVLPTTLGNVMRAGEDLAGRRYGLDAIVIWPRLYPLLPEGLKETVNDQRTQLDLAVRFCAVLFLGALISFTLLAVHGWWLLFPASLLVMTWISYRSAIAAALAYGESIQTAFDLHRFDLLKGLHLPLPATRDAERVANEALCDFLRQGVPKNLRYMHIKTKV